MSDWVSRMTRFGRRPAEAAPSGPGRLFFAARVSPAQEMAAAVMSDRLAELWPEAERLIAWVAPENYHVTLKFLGAVPQVRVASIVDAARLAIAAEAPFRLSLSGLGAFPPSGSPRVLWVGIAPGGLELARLASRIDDALEPMGFAREERVFHPHLTLARVRSRVELGPLPEIAPVEEAPHTVRTIELMESSAGPSGNRYRVLETFALRR